MCLLALLTVASRILLPWASKYCLGGGSTGGKDKGNELWTRGKLVDLRRIDALVASKFRKSCI